VGFNKFWRKYFWLKQILRKIFFYLLKNERGQGHWITKRVEENWGNYALREFSPGEVVYTSNCIRKMKNAQVTPFRRTGKVTWSWIYLQDLRITHANLMLELSTIMKFGIFQNIQAFSLVWMQVAPNIFGFCLHKNQSFLQENLNKLNFQHTILWLWKKSV